jgi:UPF0716 protein FxsA
VPILLLLLLATAVEITVLIVVGKAVGILATIGLLVLASVVGMWLLRREGTRTLMAFQEALRTRRVPAKEMADGMLIAGAGALILLPGFVSDVLALFLLFPPTRAIVSRRFARRAEQQVRSARQGGAFVVDSVIIRDDADDTPPPQRPRLDPS